MNLKQVKLELEKSQHQLQSIIHNVMDGIITLAEALLRRADEAMYQSKQNGKNTYRFATD